VRLGQLPSDCFADAPRGSGDRAALRTLRPLGCSRIDALSDPEFFCGGRMVWKLVQISVAHAGSYGPRICFDGFSMSATLTGTLRGFAGLPCCLPSFSAPAAQRFLFHQKEKHIGDY